ncbi:HAD family hydrolase [Halostella sp. JP-L12]|uniref:HAD family hydrolase n=1 Tax=Halostella TaxID=1843185 RepID=UPI000EF7F949|nr:MULTISPECIES: HAD family hydrolase [Halostella]NHN48639.1 HAD family hydrolase [Halostella sp. JP-L12]
MPYEEYDGVVYDLDGTLVDLVVDWGVVAADVEAVYEEAGIDPGRRSLWDLLEAARGHDLFDEVNEAIAAHEREGARESRRLPLADELAALDRPAAVCSLNCAEACTVALAEHGLEEYVAAVVGRDTVATWKPDPESLLAAVEATGADPSRAVFVGDSERDARAAERAGVDFVYVD